MSELADIIDAARLALQENQTAVLATVVDTSGSSYRQPGARMLVTDEGWQAGSISGGCLERDIVRRGAWLTSSGHAVIQTYDTTDDDDLIHGIGLGCRGIIRVLIERLQQPGRVDLLAFLARCLEARSPAVVATIIDADDETIIGRRLLMDSKRTMPAAIEHDLPDTDTLPVMHAAAMEALTGQQSALLSFKTGRGNIEAFIEFVAAPKPLLVFGAGHDAIPLVKFAKALAFHVTVVDSRASLAKASRFPEADQIIVCPPDKITDKVKLTPDTIALCMMHSYAADQAVLRNLLASPVYYIGMLGPKNRLNELLSDLDEEGVTVPDARLKRLYGPVGLDIGAANTEQVALSIMAEIQAVLAGRAGGHLRERKGPIHANAMRKTTLPTLPTPSPATSVACLSP